MKYKNLTKLKLIHILLLLFVISCTSDDDADSTTDPRAENRKLLGTSANELLSANIYNRLTIEIAYTTGLRPLQESIDNFKLFLEERLFKPDGITFIETEIVTPLVSTQTIEDIAAIEEAQRTQYNSGDTIAVFVYFTHASSNNDTETSKTLGSAYLNTSMVIYEQTLRDLQQSQGYDLFVLEETTLQHEFGHLLGLVNIQNDDIHDNHEDTVNGSHCKVEDCLMYYASTRSSHLFFRNRTTVPLLDPLCLEDLQFKGGK